MGRFGVICRRPAGAGKRLTANRHEADTGQIAYLPRCGNRNGNAPQPRGWGRIGNWVSGGASWNSHSVEFVDVELR